MEEQTKEEGGKFLTVGLAMLVAGLVVGFIIGWYWQKGGYNSSIYSDNTNVEATTTGVDLTNASSTGPVPQNLYKTVTVADSVSVLDQRAGNLVFIQHVDTDNPTWVTIREIVNGEIGNILGAEMVTTATDDIPVTLQRPTKVGEKYAVFLYQEDGDGEFDYKKDFLVMQGDKPVAAYFTAQ